MAINFDLADPLAGFAAGYDATDKIATGMGRRRATMALAAGDYGAARNALGEIGDVSAMRQVAADQETQGDAQRKAQAVKVEALGRTFAALLDAPEGEARAAAYQRLAPILRASGFADSEIQDGAADLSTDTLKVAAQAAGEKLRELKVGGSAESGYFAYDPANPLGSMQQMTPPGPRKPNWQEMKKADGSTYYVDMNQYAPGPSGVAQPLDGVTPAPAPAGATTPPGARGTAGSPRGLRNNNPLNLEATVQWNGMTGSDGRYAQFATPADGWAAADRNLQTYAQRHGINTVAGVINRWAPPSDNPGSATANYIASVAGALGVDPNAPLDMQDDSVRRNLAQAMASFENGRPVAWGTAGDVGAPSAATSPRPPQNQVAALGSLPPGAIPGDEAPRPEWTTQPDGSQVNIRTGERRDRPASVLNREAKEAERAQKAEQAQKAFVAKSGNVVSAVDRVLGKLGGGEAGWLGSTMAHVPGTKAYDVSRDLETIKANLGFQELQEMRSNSPTGGALGQVAVQELIALQSTIASLDIGQSEEQLRRNLQLIRDKYARAAGGAPAGAVQGGGQGGSWQAKQIDAARSAIRAGKSRSAVIQRLRQAGITPPGDL